MAEHFCDVGMYRSQPDCKNCADRLIAMEDCPTCRIGCFKPANFRNPNYDPNGNKPGIYNYAEWLCADHYDQVMEFNGRRDRGDLELWEEGIGDEN